VIDSKRREKMLKSKKKLLKLKEKGTKLVFDEDGMPHQIYELEDEDAFRKQGPAEAQRAKFLEGEAARVRDADLDDKQLAKQKKREKQEKRKAREAAEKAGIDDDEASELVGLEDGEDPMELLASLPLADEEEERPIKRPKKWFEDDSDVEKKKVSKRKRRVIEAEDEPETLEDLEALAAGLLQ
jgi:ATP-dependent RNA helicase DDX10/DBP4